MLLAFLPDEGWHVGSGEVGSWKSFPPMHAGMAVLHQTTVLSRPVTVSKHGRDPEEILWCAAVRQLHLRSLFWLGREA